MDVPPASFFASAWLSPENDRLVVVYTNMSVKDIEVELDIKGINRKYTSKKKYTTSQTKDLNEEPPTLPDENNCLIESKSVTTVVYHFSTTD
ncbi:MAG: hypothetical protein LBL33_08070 [Tannerella sp.]|jgi:hypothetical protein|nr:hypothetical protein [Tannerella sp.]